MKRKTVVGIGASVIILAIILWQQFEKLNNEVTAIVETLASNIITTRVTLSGMSIDLELGKAHIDHLFVTNPQVYYQQYILELNDIEVKYDLSSKQNNLLVIESIRINNSKISYEGHGPGGDNYKMLLRHIKNARTAENSSISDSKIKIIIDKLNIASSQAEVSSLAAKGEFAIVELPATELSNIIRTKGGVDTHEATRQLAGQLFTSIIRTAANAGVDQIISEKKRNWRDTFGEDMKPEDVLDN